MLQPEFSCRLGIFAWESDLIDAEQLALAFKTWVVNPTVPLVELMVEEGSLTSEDVQLLRTLWTEQTREINQDQTQDGSRDHVDSSGSSVMQVAEMGAEGFQANHRFEIIAELASGGLGKVSIAMDKTLKRKVAIKEMLSSHAHHPEARIRFTREAELTGQLEHPSIVPIHHLGVSAGDVPFYSMRLIEGKTLRELAKELKESMPGEIRFRSREFRRLLTSFITVCQAVEHAHSRKIVHRDIKPSNIVVGDHGETLLVDWGLAKAFKIRELAEEQTEICGVEETQRSRIEPGESDLDDFSVDLTAAGVAAGTAAYMSPEQTADAANAGPSSDIFSLGATLYYLLTGQAPYGGREYGEILAAARAGQYAFPRKVCSAVPLPLEAICQKAMAFSPKDRYPTAASLAEDIELWLADEPISICRDPLATRLRRWFVRHRAWSTAIAVSILAGLIGAAIFSSLTAYNHQLLKVAHDREQTARQIADHQGELALQTLKSVAWKIQQELQHIPAAQRVRRSLLEHLLDGLESVSIHLAQPREADMYAVRVHRDLGDMFLQIGNFGDRQGIALARRELRTALAKAEALSAQNPDDVEALRQLAITLQHLADLESRYGSTATALEMRWTALRSLEDLHRRAPDNEQVIRSRYVAHNLLGDLYVQLGQYADAGSHYLEALQIIDAQAGRGVQLPELKRDFVVSLNKVAGHYSRKGDPRLAEELYRRSLVATQALVEEHPDDFKYLRDLSTVHYQLGKICLAVGNFREAVEHHQRSQELDARRFDLDPANALAHRDLLESTMQLAETLRMSGNQQDAMFCAQDAIDIGERLLLVDPEDRRAIRYLAYALSDLGEMEASAWSAGHNQSMEFIPHFERCLWLMQQSAVLDADNPRGQWDVAFGLTKLASGLLSANRVQEAIERLQQALPIHRERFMGSSGDLIAQRNLLEALKLAAVAHHQAEQRELALEHFEEATQHAAELVRQAPDDVVLRVLQIETLEALGLFHLSCDRHSAAHAAFHEALTLAESLAATDYGEDRVQAWINRLNTYLD